MSGETSVYSSLLDDYMISDMDTAANYYGFVRNNGSWLIMKLGAAAVTYCKGNSDYATAWTGRAALTYTSPEGL
jgi:hypothetical protein